MRQNARTVADNGCPDLRGPAISMTIVPRATPSTGCRIPDNMRANEPRVRIRPDLTENRYMVQRKSRRFPCRTGLFRIQIILFIALETNTVWSIGNRHPHIRGQPRAAARARTDARAGSDRLAPRFRLRRTIIRRRHYCRRLIRNKRSPCGRAGRRRLGGR